MKLARRIERAREEIVRCNVEARRLHTSIRDEDLLFGAVLDDMKARQDLLHGAVLDYCTRRRAVNAHLLACIQKLYSLHGFTGTPSPGQRKGAPLPAIRRPPEFDSRVPAEAEELEREAREGLELDDDDDDAGDIGGLVDYVANLTLV
ncbi:hypothetical protein B0H21DRAFT_710783 [Amylocystis lapponica]|nr:hypothetical protein B0H21DRAFT_710783 [Amylocystis lapponica]